MRIGLSTIVVVGASQTSCELHDETVILDFNKGAFFGLDEIGTFIWQRLQQPQAVSEVFDAVIQQYDVDRAVCEQDVVRLLERLHAVGLIDVRDELAASGA